LKFFWSKKQNDLSDLDLIDMYRKSANTWYAGELFQRYTQLITAVAYNYLQNNADTEDAVMEVFEIILRDLRHHQVNNFKTWVYSVTKHHCLKKLRKDNAESVELEQVLRQLEAEDVSAAEAIEFEKQVEELKSALTRLSTEQKECIELFYFKQKSYKEVSDETGFSINEVKSYLQNGKRNLKGLLTTSK
jgi:RNA polymerase sigma factor (sigma-70 family)